MALHSIQVEKHYLGGLIQHPEIFAETEGFVSEAAFCVKPHDVIFGCIRSAVLNNEKLDKVLIAQKVKNLGISFKEDIDIFSYLEAITFTPITAKAAIEAAKQLVKLKALRDIESACDDVKTYVNKAVNEPVEKIITEADRIYNEKIKTFEFEDEPDDVFSDIYEMVEERGNNPIQEMGLIWPYPEFNRLYGGARNGDIYAIASRPKQGKTTWLNYTGAEMGALNNCPVLNLDTEMTTVSIKWRQAAGFSGVPLWYLETGNFRKNKEMMEKVRLSLPQLKKRPKVYHYYVGNKTVDEVASIVRRWILSVVGRGNPCIVVYDYLKLTGEKLGQNWAEHQALGEKVNKLKALSQELQFPLLTAIQLNRTGDNRGKEVKDIVDSSSAVSQTDRLAWFTTYLGIFRRRTPEELLLDTPESGTHKLVELFARYQGRDAAGHQDLIQRTFPDGSTKLVENFINYKITNFKVEECGSLRDTIKRQNSKFKITDAVVAKEDDTI
jgi:replicative DNA helicase